MAENTVILSPMTRCLLLNLISLLTLLAESEGEGESELHSIRVSRCDEEACVSEAIFEWLEWICGQTDRRREREGRSCTAEGE